MAEGLTDGMEIAFGDDSSPRVFPVRVSYFDPATGRPTDHRVTKRRTNPDIKPRACVRCGKAFKPKEADTPGRMPERICPACRKEERDRWKPGARREVVLVDKLTGKAERKCMIDEAAKALGMASKSVANQADEGRIGKGWLVARNPGFGELTYTSTSNVPVIAEDEGGVVAFSNATVAARVLGVSSMFVCSRAKDGRPFPFAGRQVTLRRLDKPDASLEGVRRWYQ